MDVPAFPDAESALRAALADSARHEAGVSALRGIGKGVGAGLAVGGSLGLLAFLRRPSRKLRQRLQPAEADLPVKTATALRRLPKHADGPLTAGGVWWKNPVAITGGLAAGLGTWAAARKLGRSVKRREQASAEEAAKREFDAALAEALGPHAKAAADGEPTLRQLLEVAFQHCKQAGWWDSAKDFVGQLPSHYGTYAGVSGLLGGVLAYRAFANQNRKALKAAVKQRQRDRLAREPVELSLQPVPGTTPADLQED